MNHEIGLGVIMKILVPTLLVLVSAARSDADTILVGTPHDPSVSYASDGLHQYNIAEAQGFSLNSESIVDEIRIGVFSDQSDSTYTYQITDKIGVGILPSDVLFSATTSSVGVSPCGPPPPCLPDYVRIATPPLLLPAGQYFLTGAENIHLGGLSGAMWLSTSQFLNGVGTPEQKYYSTQFTPGNPADGNWLAYNSPQEPASLDFELIGHTVPEPPAFVLLLVGLTYLFFTKRKR